MPVTQLQPHIHFNGQAEEAITFYERALGAKVESLMRWGDGPHMDAPPEFKRRVMHSVVRIGAGSVTISDAPPQFAKAPGGNLHIMLEWEGASDAEMQQAFDALAAGGQVSMALHDAFWGARYGDLTDKFGVRWAFNRMKR